MDFTYALDIAQDPLDIETKQRVSALLYFTENEIGDSKYDFLKKHPQELMDIIDYWPGSKEDSLNEIFDLYCRYRESIKRAILRMDKSYSGASSVDGSSFYGRVSQRTDYEKEKQDLFDERVKNSVFVLYSQSQDNPRQGSGFYLNDYGLLTSHHVIEDNEFYNVCTCEHYPEHFKVVGTTLNLVCCSNGIDYALFSMDDGNDLYFPLGDSSSLGLGDPVKVIGYPNHCEGDTWELLKTDFKKKTQLFGHPLYEVTLAVRHGASGGVVLDKEDRIVGLICAGVESMEESPSEFKQGFIPINTILQDIAIKGC